MIQPASLRDLLRLEDDPAFAALACPSTGVPAWPAIRIETLRLALSALLYKTRPLIGAEVRLPLAARLQALARAAAHNLGHRPAPAQVLIWGTGAGLIERGGRSFNRYTDYFADCLGDEAWTAEGFAGLRAPAAPRAIQRLSLRSPGEVAASLLARAAAGPVHRRLAAALVELVEQRARAVLDWRLEPQQLRWLSRLAAHRLAGYPLQRRLVASLLRRVRPRLLLVEEGCYGHMAQVNATARDHGVTVAELQHGVVGSGHDAYNLAPALAASSAWRRTLPAAFLGYGEYWNRSIDVPLAKVALGNPHRSEVVGALPARQGPRTDVLVLGDGIETELTLGLCQALARLLPARLRVVFRPHPLERARLAGLAGSAGRGFALDLSPDIYPSLAASHAVVAEVSTGLFEAAGLAERVLVWNTAKSRFSMPEHPFAVFEGAEDLAAKITGTSLGAVSPEEVSEVWAPDWRARFLDYVHGPGSAGGLSPG